MHFGFGPAIWRYVSILASRDRLAVVRVPGQRETVSIRPGTTDEDVFREVFLAREYEIPLGEPRFIIDAGAHIGLASVFFARRCVSTILRQVPATFREQATRSRRAA
jgi:hypothetical protein